MEEVIIDTAGPTITVRSSTQSLEEVKAAALEMLREAAALYPAPKPSEAVGFGTVNTERADSTTLYTYEGAF